jgi:hypothetical protein
LSEKDSLASSKSNNAAKIWSGAKKRKLHFFEPTPSDRSIPTNNIKAFGFNF